VRELTIKEILALDSGEVVPSITGKIAALYDWKSDEGEYGPYSVQSGMLTQDGQPPIRFSAWNFDNLKSLKGKQVTISANKSEKHGLTGLVAVDNEFRGKVTRELKITGSATIEETEWGDAPRETQNDVKETGTSPRLSNAATKSDPEDADNGIIEARRHLMQSANLYVLCTHAVDKVIMPELLNSLKTNEIFQAAVSTLYIEASRAGLVDKMPSVPVKAKSEQSKQTGELENDKPADDLLHEEEEREW